MNDLLPEIKNPLSNGKVVQYDTPIRVYLEAETWTSERTTCPVPILSRSDLCDIYESPHKWHESARLDIVEPDEHKANIEFGSLFDCLLLQPSKFSEYYLLAPATYETKKGETKDWTWKSSTCREWREEQEAAGHLVCTQEALQEAQAAMAALINHPDLGNQTNRLIQNSKHQVFVIAEYHDEATGMVVPVKCLTDIVPDENDPEFGKCLFDLKTALTAHPKKWKKSVFDNDYHVQAAINLDCHQATGEDRVDFRHLIVENTAPWEPARRFLSSEYLTLGRMKYLSALKTYCRCVKEDKWPSYAPADTVLVDGYESTGPEAFMIQI
jgi:hypothetical protein